MAIIFRSTPRNYFPFKRFGGRLKGATYIEELAQQRRRGVEIPIALLSDLLVRNNDLFRAVSLEWKYTTNERMAIKVDYPDNSFLSIKANGPLLRSKDWVEPPPGERLLDSIVEADITPAQLEIHEKVPKGVVETLHDGQETIPRLVLLYLTHCCSKLSAENPKIKNLKVVWYLTPSFGVHLAAGALAECWVSQESEQQSEQLDHEDSKHVAFMQALAAALVGPIEGRILEKVAKMAGSRNVRHRLPATLDSIIDSLERQRDRPGVPVMIPPEAYMIKMVSAVERDLKPRWPRYEERCNQGEGHILTGEVVQKIWEEVASSIGYARVNEEPGKEFTLYIKEVPRPILERISPQQKIVFEDANECAAVISLCVPLLIEAYQHALMYSILEYSETKVGHEAKVTVSLSPHQIAVTNPAHRPTERRRTLLSAGTQRAELVRVARIFGSTWSVELPLEAPEPGELWIAKLTRGES